MLSWDQNLAMGGMGSMGGKNRSEKNKQAAMDEWLKEGGFGTGTTTNSDRKMEGGRNSTNTLKTRFMTNPKFLAMYESIYATLKTEIFDQGLGSKIVDQFALPFLKYNSQTNLLNQAEYQTQADSKTSFFTSTS